MVRTNWLTTEDDLSAVMEIRHKTFPEEWGSSTDESDNGALILLVYDGDTPVATGRITPLGDAWLLGRIAVVPEYRRQSLGSFLVRLLIRRAYELGSYEQYVHARPQAVGFYEKLGFVTCKTVDGVIKMRHIGDVYGKC